MGASCCGSKAVGDGSAPERDATADVNSNQDSCGGGCCSAETGTTGQATAHGAHQHDDAGGHGHGDDAGCCGGCDGPHDGNTSTDSKAADDCAGCCSDSPAPCCDDESVSDTSDATTCCGSDGRCDESCIYAVAAIECGKACSNDPGHEKSQDHPHEHDTTGHKSYAACSSHLQAAFDQYSSYIEQLRCICRSVISPTVSKHTCCMGNEPAKDAPGRKMATGHRHRHAGHHHHDHHAGNHHHDHHAGHRQRKRHGHDMPLFKPSGPGSNGTAGVAQTDDLEKASVETVEFVVGGMDCTSCADKLLRVFDAMRGVSQARVNFVRGNGEFSLDTSITNADEVIAFASTASGFRIAKILGGDFFLDVLIARGGTTQLLENLPEGVTDVQALNKKTARLTYDPALIGARDLFDRIEDRCGGLAPPQGDPQLESSKRRLWDQLSKTLLAAIFTIPVCVVSFGKHLVTEKTGAIISLALGTVVQAIAVPEFYRPALAALWYSRTIEMDMLVVMSITAAYVYSVVAFGFTMAGKPLEQEQFFETSTLLITLILAGRLVAAFARIQAVKSVSLRSQQNSRAVLVTKDGDRDLDARLLQYGDQFKVLPHSRIPTDGTILVGASEVDESMLTGESMPVTKGVGDRLIAGTVNGDGTVVASLTRLPGKNTVTDIAQLVEDAANSKPRMQDLANKVASWFVPVMATVSVLVFVIWIGAGLGIRDWAAGKSVGNAVTYAVATLAVACPCALGLAVPMVLVVAGGIAARGGVIIKSADTTERARKTTDVVFDKTGTITEGKLAVVKTLDLQEGQGDVMALVKAMVAGAKHPVSAAVDRHLESLAVKPVAGVANTRVVPGAGVVADWGGGEVKAGSAQWTKTEELSEVRLLIEAGLTTLVVVKDSTPLAAFGLRTRLRPEAVGVISELKARNVTVHMVSGDNIKTVKTTAAAVGIPLDQAVGEQTPAQKRAYVASLTEDPAKFVMFCGDGTNDAVAVAQADVGVQMGDDRERSDVTQSAADVLLLHDLEGIPFLLDMSKASFHRMAFNFGWSAVYNVLAVTMASGAWIDFRIAPAYAGLGEVVSVLPVILAAMSLFLHSTRYRAKKT